MSLELLQWQEEPSLPQIFEVLRLDGGLGPVTVNFLQADIVISRLVLAAPSLGLQGASFLAHGGGGVQLGG